MLRIVVIVLVIWAALHNWHDGQPRLQLGGTTLTGRHLQPYNLDFFGGDDFLFITRSPPHPSISGIPFADPPVADLRLSPPRPKLSLSPLRKFDARSYGLQCLQPVRYSPLSFA